MALLLRVLLVWAMEVGWESVGLIKHVSSGFVYPVVSYPYAMSERRLHKKADWVPPYITVSSVNVSYVWSQGIVFRLIFSQNLDRGMGYEMFQL